MRKIILTITLAGLSILMFISCRDKCDSDYLGEVAFTEEDLKIVPYNGTETLVFTDSLGNTMSFTGQGYYSDYKTLHYENPTSYDCLGNYFYSQFYRIQFNHMLSDYNISFSLSMNGGSPFFKNIKNTIYFWIEYKEDSKYWHFDKGFYFNHNNIYQGIDTLDKKILFKDSLIIGSNNIHSVYQLEQTKDPYPSLNIQYLYYTIKEGIVGFKTKEGHLWYLKN